MANGIIQCSKCPTESDNLDLNPHAWDGWQIASETSESVCPDCIRQGLAIKGFEIVRSQVNGRHIDTLIYRGTNP